MKDPVAFGKAEPDSTTLPIVVRGDEIVGADRWPSACGLLTDGEIKGLLPQAKTVERTPQQVDVIAIFDDAQNQTAKEGTCTYSFWLEGATIKGVNASIEVRILAIAAPARVARHYAEELADDRDNENLQQVEDRGTTLGPEACYTKLDGSRVESYVVCRQGPLMFEISGGGAGSYAGVPNELDAERDYWRDKVQLPSAALIAAKVP
jgi:hypothetical protein